MDAPAPSLTPFAYVPPPLRNSCWHGNSRRPHPTSFDVVGCQWRRSFQGRATAGPGSAGSPAIVRGWHLRWADEKSDKGTGHRQGGRDPRNFRRGASDSGGRQGLAARRLHGGSHGGVGMAFDDDARGGDLHQPVTEAGTPGQSGREDLATTWSRPHWSAIFR
jgi:hypothetical protein